MVDISRNVAVYKKIKKEKKNCKIVRENETKGGGDAEG